MCVFSFACHDDNKNMPQSSALGALNEGKIKSLSILLDYEMG